MMDPKLDLKSPCKDSLDEWSKTFCLKTVYKGAKKLVSNNASLEFYDQLIDGKYSNAFKTFTY